jgi:hypothetical protein
LQKSGFRHLKQKHEIGLPTDPVLFLLRICRLIPCARWDQSARFEVDLHETRFLVGRCRAAASGTGTDVMILKIFLPKNSAKKLAFLTQNKAKLFKILIIILVFEKNANFFAENCQKSQKIVIITSTPD